MYSLSNCHIYFFISRKEITAGQKIRAKLLDFHNHVLLNGFDFWQFSIAPRHVRRYGKFLNPKIFAPFGLWKSSNQTLPEAQRTQGIESITWVIYPALEIECHLHWFQIWPIVCGSTCISSKFDHQVMPPESVPDLANM